MKNFLLEIFFPKICVNCAKPGTYLCSDCLSLIDISENILFSSQYLSAVFAACDYNHFIVKNLIHQFKYSPFAKDLNQVLVSLIIIYFQNLTNKPEFFTAPKEFLLVPIPLSAKRLHWRGFNQTEEIAKSLSEFLKIPLALNTLIKTKETLDQTKLPEKQRQENIKNVFACQNKEIIKNKNIILVDDVYTTGATMEEAAKILKQSGAEKIYGVVVARG